MTAPVFFGSVQALAALSIGDSFVLDGPEGHHAAVVQRLHPGQQLDLVDGETGRRLSGTVTAQDKTGLTLTINEVALEPIPAPSLTLVQALAKGGRDDQAIEAATELGVDTIIPWQASRSIVQWKEDRAERALDRWIKAALAATKQSRRSRIPKISPLLSSRTKGALANWAQSVVSTGGLVLVLHESAATRLSSIDLSGQLPSQIAILVGPEGGITDEELSELSAAGAIPVLLGDTVLRASSAGPAALAVVSSRIGRW